MSAARFLLATAAGLLLATLPFVRYAHWAGHGAAHADHEPHHGGQLGMTGDFHIELKRGPQQLVEAFVSDAWRRPVHPREGWLVFDRDGVVPLRWQDDRLVGADTTPAREIEAIVVLTDGTRLALSFDFSPVR